jgi:DNA-binding NtrC family response regulator
MKLGAILIVEDHDELRGLLRLTLATAGYQVETAANGRLAIEALDRRDFDLVLTDLIMPEKDGFELIDDISRTHAGVRIIAMTGGDQRVRSQQVLQNASGDGTIMMLEKPFTPKQLRESVAQAFADSAA